MADEHTKKPKEWEKFFRNRHPPKHITKCSTGYRQPGTCEVHHLLCVHACSDAEIDSESETYIHDCMAITTWDINEGHNTIGLPKKSAYDRPEHSTMGTAEVPEGWDGLPCHMVEHNPTHTTEVVNWVKTNIWTKLKSAKNGERCEEVEQKRIHDMFKAGSDFFRKELTEIRGKREGGTKSVIDGGFKAEKWYEPFSMAEFPLSRPRPTQNPKGSLEQFLKEIF